MFTNVAVHTKDQELRSFCAAGLESLCKTCMPLTLALMM